LAARFARGEMEVEMSTPASIKSHPIHAMLVPLPIGAWIFALVADIMVHFGRTPGWRSAAYYALGVGVLGALLAAAPGLIDLMSLPKGRTRQIGILHMGLNLLAVVVFAVNFLVRRGNPDHSGMLRLTAIGVALIALSGWLGGEMVYVGGVGVSPAAKGETTPPPRP
jgi:uncharacterized membrane protein